MLDGIILDFRLALYWIDRLTEHYYCIRGTMDAFLSHEPHSLKVEKLWQCKALHGSLLEYKQADTQESRPFLEDSTTHL